jgi:hypothetical protein
VDDQDAFVVDLGIANVPVAPGLLGAVVDHVPEHTSAVVGGVHRLAVRRVNEGVDVVERARLGRGQQPCHPLDVRLFRSLAVGPAHDAPLPHGVSVGHRQEPHAPGPSPVRGDRAVSDFLVGDIARQDDVVLGRARVLEDPVGP